MFVSTPHRTKVVAGDINCVSTTPKGGRAEYHSVVRLQDASFKVYEGGVRRAQREQRRNVHAWAVGRLVFTYEDYVFPRVIGSWKKVSYHYNEGRFIDEFGNDVTDHRYRDMICNGPTLYVAGRIE